MKLTEYDVKIFGNLQKLKVDKWYEISNTRHDKLELIDSIKKFHECFGLIEFSSDMSSFKLVLRENKVLAKLSMSDDEKYQNTSELDGVESIKTLKPYIHTKKENKELIQAEIDSKRKPIPGICSRPDIVSRIMEEHNRPENEKQDKLNKEQERLKRIKEWKSSSL